MINKISDNSDVTKANPINSYAALLLEYLNQEKEAKKLLVISDLHLGSETDLIKKGITINSLQISVDVLKEIKDLNDMHSFTGVIILGDLKNSITNITKLEWDIIPSFLDQLSVEMDEVFLIPGNHDANINLLTPESVIVCNPGGLIIEDTLLIHGHAIPAKNKSNIKKIIMGHIHPFFFDPDSVIHGKRLWIYLKVKKEYVFGLNTDGILEIIIVPTFNKYFYSLSSQSKEMKSIRSISPLIRHLINNDAILSGLMFTLEGSLIGGIQEIKKLFYK